MGSAQVALTGDGRIGKQQKIIRIQDDVLAGKLLLHPGGV